MIDALGLPDVYAALEELSGMVTTSVPLLIIDHCTKFDPTLDELDGMIYLFRKFKNHFANSVANVVSNDLYCGLGRIAHPYFLLMRVDFVPFRDLGEASVWALPNPALKTAYVKLSYPWPLVEFKQLRDLISFFDWE